MVSRWRRGGGSPLRRFLSVALLALLALPVALDAQHSTPKSHSSKPVSSLRGSDVMATVEGESITRRELTYYWLQVDRTRADSLGALLAERWKTDKGASPRYILSESDIYRALYSPKADYVPTLDSLITIKLVGIVAKRHHITVTDAQAKTRAHELFEAFRKQTNSKMSDDDVMARFQVPRDIFRQDMVFRVEAEALLALEFARRNKHPIAAGDWIEVRALFAKAEDLGEPVETEKQFTAAKTRLMAWVEEVRGGKAFADVAKAHNQDASADNGGVQGLSLRGTGTPDNVLFTLKPGEMSKPVRVKTGWFVFTAARRGAEIPAVEREAAWKAIVETTLPTFLDTLRKTAHIKKG